MGQAGAVVFDLDGTLIDSAPDLLATVNLLLDEEGYGPLSLDGIVPMIGDGIPALVLRAFTARGAPPAPGVLDRLAERFISIYLDPARPQLTRVYADVLPTLERLRAAGFTLAVCTNKVERAAVQLLRELGLAEAFDAVVGGDTVPAKKPDPAHVTAALRRLDHRDGLAAMVGDSSNDIAAAVGAGAFAIGVTYGYGDMGTVTPAPDCTIDRFAELPEALAWLAERPRTEPGRSCT